jgi:chromosome segregation ATPase
MSASGDGPRGGGQKQEPPVARMARSSSAGSAMSAGSALPSGSALPAGSRLSEKVIVTNQRLLEIQREEEEALLELLRENEALSRDTVLIEMEIRRHKRLREQFDADRADTEREMRRVNAERERLTAAQRDHDLELQRLREGLATLKGEVASTMRQKEELLRAHGELQNEIDRLHEQNERLGQDIERMRDLKAEYLKSIAKYKDAQSEQAGRDLPI